VEKRLDELWGWVWWHWLYCLEDDGQRRNGGLEGVRHVEKGRDKGLRGMQVSVLH